MGVACSSVCDRWSGHWNVLVSAKLCVCGNHLGSGEATQVTINLLPVLFFLLFFGVNVWTRRQLSRSQRANHPRAAAIFVQVFCFFCFFFFFLISKRVEVPPPRTEAGMNFKDFPFFIISYKIIVPRQWFIFKNCDWWKSMNTVGAFIQTGIKWRAPGLSLEFKSLSVKILYCCCNFKKSFVNMLRFFTCSQILQCGAVVFRSQSLRAVIEWWSKRQKENASPLFWYRIWDLL